jgi:hypothetical protein
MQGFIRLPGPGNINATDTYIQEGSVTQNRAQGMFKDKKHKTPYMLSVIFFARPYPSSG